jgi:plastocyanin
MRVSLAWVLRFALLLVFFAVGFYALLTAKPSDQAPAALALPTQVPPTSVPLPTLTPRPTQTPQAITSIIIRGTPEAFPTPTRVPAGGLATVDIVDFSYMPNVTRIKAGQSVFWRNAGTEQHDVSGSDWHSGPLDPTYTYILTFGTPGTYAYRCSIHLDMTGSVIVS